MSVVVSVSDDVISAIRHEHGLAHGHFKRALDHMIRCGELLIEAQANVPRGMWGEWTSKELGIHRKTVSTYIRFARHANVLRESGAETGIEARKVLAELDIPRANSADHLASEAKKMRANGMKLKDIGEYFGVSHARVSQWLNREDTLRKSRAARARLKKAKQIAKAQEDARAVRSCGNKEISDAYSLVRRALSRLDSGDFGNASRMVNLAMSSLHEAEDFIVRASKEFS